MAWLIIKKLGLGLMKWTLQTKKEGVRGLNDHKEATHEKKVTDQYKKDRVRFHETKPVAS